MCGAASEQIAPHSAQCGWDGPFRWAHCLHCRAVAFTWNGLEWECENQHWFEALPCPRCQAIGVNVEEEFVCAGPEEHTFYYQYRPCETCEAEIFVFLIDSSAITCALCGAVQPREQYS